MGNSSLIDLIELARDPDPAARFALSQKITDICLQAPRLLNPQEKEVAGHILIQLSRDFESQLRSSLAHQLAASDRAPKQLILALASDEISVSAPVISLSPLLDETDLVEIVMNKTNAHRLGVAMRSGITAAVSNALVQSEEPDVLQALVNNKSAEISGAALEYLVTESKVQPNLQGPLIARDDLSPVLVQKMFAFVSNNLRSEIQSRYDIDGDILDAAFRGAASPVTVAAAASGPVAINKAAALVAKMRASGELSLNRIIGFLREKRLNLFLEGLAVMCELDARTITSLAFEGEGQGMAVVCRAIGADRSQFATITLLLERARTGKAVPAARLQAVCQLFDTMPVERATGVIEQWRARGRPAGKSAA
ncbi:MAG: DUF2336 domain-containing protein [Alphaproteobacteria bacterium]